MSEASNQTEAAPEPKRGEAAWKAEKADIARRNDQTQKAGRQVREDRDRRAAATRHAADMRDRDSLN